MPDRDRRQTADSLESLEKLIERMDALGREAEDAAARVTELLREKLDATSEQRQTLLTALSDVIEIVSERGRLAHKAHRLITEIRRREMNGWRRSAVESG
jgi:hypothetical protein